MLTPPIFLADAIPSATAEVSNEAMGTVSRRPTCREAAALLLRRQALAIGSHEWKGGISAMAKKTGGKKKGGKKR